jgi:hypothetical protein
MNPQIYPFVMVVCNETCLGHRLETNLDKAKETKENTVRCLDADANYEYYTTYCFDGCPGHKNRNVKCDYLVATGQKEINNDRNNTKTFLLSQTHVCTQKDCPDFGTHHIHIPSVRIVRQNPKNEVV